MNRRNFLTSLSLSPLFIGCATAVNYDASKHGRLTRVGIIEYPHGLGAAVSRSANMYAAAGEDEAIRERLGLKLGNRCDGFGKAVRDAIAATLSAHGVQSRTTRHIDTGGVLNPIYRAPKFADIGEPVYLESQPTIMLVWSEGQILPGASSLNRLVAQRGDILWNRSVAVGSAIHPHLLTLPLATARYQDIGAAFSQPAEELAAELMRLAAPLGNTIASQLLGASGTSRT